MSLKVPYKRLVIKACFTNQWSKFLNKIMRAISLVLTTLLWNQWDDKVVFQSTDKTSNTKAAMPRIVYTMTLPVEWVQHSLLIDGPKLTSIDNRKQWKRRRSDLFLSPSSSRKQRRTWKKNFQKNGLRRSITLWEPSFISERPQRRDLKRSLLCRWARIQGKSSPLTPILKLAKTLWSISMLRNSRNNLQYRTPLYMKNTKQKTYLKN